MLPPSWDSLKQRFRSYPRWGSVEKFVSGMEALRPKLVLLFGSLVKGDFTQHSDADVLVVLEQPLDWLKVYRYSDGVVQPVVKSWPELQQALTSGNTFLGEIIEDGLLLWGEEAGLAELRQRWRHAREALGLKREERGWRLG